ncbi:MAG: elongation factor G [Nitrospirae bacterium]|nr:elongation factor G [Nitrospirota bacterium]
MSAAEKTRTIGLFAPTGAGKTTLSEAILFTSGASTRMGKVSAGNTVMDFEPEETRRQVSISAAVAHCTWKEHLLFLLDTPGNDNFLADAYAAARVVDGAVFVTGLGDAVRYQTKRLWRILEQNRVPRIVFLGKADLETAKFDPDALRQGLGGAPLVALHYPVQDGNRVMGFVDVLKRKAYRYEKEGGATKEIEIPAQAQAGAQAAREKAIEAVAEVDDALLERYLDGRELGEEELTAALRKGVQAAKLFPVLIGSAVSQQGVPELLDRIVQWLPSPLDRAPVLVQGDAAGGVSEKKPGGNGFAGLVFKTVADPHIGQLSYLRVFSGSLSSDATILNLGKKEKERVGQVLRLFGRMQTAVPAAGPGELVAVPKLKYTSTGDTLGEPAVSSVFAPITFPRPVLSYAVKPRAKGDEEKIMSALARLSEEDPTLSLRREQQTKELILSGLGDVHIEVVLEKMKRKFGVEVDKQVPQIPYKETVRKKIQADGKYVRQSGGRGQYGWCWLEVEPLARGTGYEFVDKIFGGAIPKNFIPSVEKGVQEALAEGPLAGFPVTDIRVTLFDGKYHDVDSSDMAFRIAGSMGFKKAAEQAQPVVLEPIVTLQVSVPEDHVGGVIADLNSRRARVQGMEAVGEERVIKAQVPLPEVVTYAAGLTSITGGAGEFSYEFSHYEEVPTHLAQKLVEARKKAQAAKESQ